MNDIQLDKALSKAGAPTPNNASKHAIGGNSGRAMHTKVIAQTGGGKTTWLIRCLCSKEHGTKQFDFVVWAAPRASLDQAAMGLLRKVWGPFLTVVPSDDKLDGQAIDAAMEAGRAKGHGPCCCMFDDLLRCSRSPWLKQAHTNFRLRGISIFELSQQIFDGAKTSRLNCSAYVVGKFALQREMARFAAEITTPREKEALLTKACRGITKRKHGFLIVMLDTDLGAVRGTKLDMFVRPLWDLQQCCGLHLEQTTDMASECQQHVAKMMRQGHSMKAAAAEWRKMKGGGGAAKPKPKAKAKGGSIAMWGGAINMKGGGGARRRRTIVAAAAHQGGLGLPNEQIGDEDEGSGLNMAGGNFADSFLSGVSTAMRTAAPFVPLLL